MKIRLAGLSSESIVDGPGIRFTIFVQGCPHHCEGCHNPETHDFEAGRLADTDKILAAIEKNPMIKGVTFSGGEPFCQAEPLAELAMKLKEKGYNLLSFTGFTFEELTEMAKEDKNIKKLLSLLDYMIDGQFVLSQRSLELKYKGSRNQRTLDVQESLKQEKAVEIEL